MAKTSNVGVAGELAALAEQSTRRIAYLLDATSVLLEDLVTGGENDGETSEEMTQAAVKALVEKRPLVLEINRNINECLATVDAQVHGLESCADRLRWLASATAAQRIESLSHQDVARDGVNTNTDRIRARLTPAMLKGGQRRMPNL